MIRLAWGKVRQATRRWRGVAARWPLILVYHRIAPPEHDPWRLCVSPEHFKEQLAILCERFHPCPLRGLTESLEADTALPPRTVILTFDDGYADNFYTAAPLLRHYGVPATIFLATASLQAPQPFWWDELAAILLAPPSLPPQLVLQIGASTHRWEQGKIPTDVRARYTFYRSLWALLQPLDPHDRRRLLATLRGWAGLADEPLALPATLTPAEVVALAGERGIEIGAHTVTHPMLAALPAEAQREEIFASRASLEALLGRPVTTFAYPFGKVEHFTAESVALVRDAGFQAGCTTVAGAVHRTADRFQLPRLQVPDWGGKAFAGWLEGHYG